MVWSRLYRNAVYFTALIALVVACAGCWEKIEYTGPRTTSTPRPPQAAGPSETTPPTESPVAASSPETPVAAPPAPPIAPTETASAPAVGDRYATPAVVDTPPPAEPPSAAAAPVDGSGSSTTAAPAATTELPPHTDATAASATTETPRVPALDSRRAAWLLGSRLSLAALANDRGVAAKSVPIWFEDARTAAKFLGTTVDDLPAPAPNGDGSLASRQVIDYLATTNGQRIGRELSKAHGKEESALFEVALKSNILLLLYVPDSSAGGSVAAAISQAAPSAKLPAELWQPLVDVLNKHASQADVRAAVRKMHIDVEQYLTQRAEQKGQ